MMRSDLVDKEAGGIRLLGYSLAGEETVVAAPELNVCFDVGRAPQEILAIDHVCLTHGHMDHAAGIAYYFSQRNFVGNSAGTVLLHHDLVSPLKRVMSGWAEMEGHPSPMAIMGMGPGDEHAIARGRIIRAFGVNHGAGSLGFTLIESRLKLKAEFANRTGPQLVELKKQGVQIQYEARVPLLTYVGDTAAGGWVNLDEVRNSQVVVIECTFFSDEHLHRARQGRHLHVRDIAEVIAPLRSRHIVLTHVTRRTSLREARNALRSVLSASDRERVQFFMERPRRPGPGREEGL